MKKIGTTALLALLVVGLAITAIPAPKATVPSDGWTLIAQRGLKAYPDLMETVWQKNASAPPNGPFDIIGLHRVVKTGIPVGVLFICPGTWGSGEQLISNPPTDPWTKTENYTEALYWANRGFDVYSIDYRTHFVPINLNSSQLAFMANWGWDQWISDIKEAVDKAKEVSGAERMYMAGQSFGGIAAMNYATLYGKQDLKGLIILDAAAVGLTDGLGAKNPNPTNSYNLTDAIAQMNTAGSWAYEADSGALFTFQYADQNPGAPAEFPPGTPVTPPLNPYTNEPWTNITEWAVYVTVIGWGYAAISNIYGGYGNAAVDIHICATFDRYWPTRLGLQTTAYSDWNNCPDITHDFDDQYSSINVPLLAFQSQYFGNLVFGPFKDGIANPVFNATVLLGYGHLDVFSGVYCERDVSAPTYDWMVARAHDPPTANFTWSPLIPKVGDVVTFDASSSIPGGGSIVGNRWDFGDGQTSSGQTTVHTYTNAATYTATLNVTDSNGLWNTTQKQVQVVQSHGPKAEFTAITETTNVGVKFDATASQPGWNGTNQMPITEYRWDFGDGNKTTVTTATINHAFSSPGTYYPTLTVYASGVTPETDAITHRVVVVPMPVGGYSFSLAQHNTPMPSSVYLALLIMLSAVFTTVRRKTRKEKNN